MYTVGLPPTRVTHVLPHHTSLRLFGFGSAAHSGSRCTHLAGHWFAVAVPATRFAAHLPPHTGVYAVCCCHAFAVLVVTHTHVPVAHTLPRLSWLPGCVAVAFNAYAPHGSRSACVTPPRVLPTHCAGCLHPVPFTTTPTVHGSFLYTVGCRTIYDIRTFVHRYIYTDSVTTAHAHVTYWLRTVARLHLPRRSCVPRIHTWFTGSPHTHTDPRYTVYVYLPLPALRVTLLVLLLHGSRSVGYLITVLRGSRFLVHGFVRRLFCYIYCTGYAHGSFTRTRHYRFTHRIYTTRYCRYPCRRFSSCCYTLLLLPGYAVHLDCRFHCYLPPRRLPVAGYYRTYTFTRFSCYTGSHLRIHACLPTVLVRCLWFTVPRIYVGCLDYLPLPVTRGWIRLPTHTPARCLPRYPSAYAYTVVLTTTHYRSVAFPSCADLVLVATVPFGWLLHARSCHTAGSYLRTLPHFTHFAVLPVHTPPVGSGLFIYKFCYIGFGYAFWLPLRLRFGYLVAVRLGSFWLLVIAYILVWLPLPTFYYGFRLRFYGCILFTRHSRSARSGYTAVLPVRYAVYTTTGLPFCRLRCGSFCLPAYRLPFVLVLPLVCLPRTCYGSSFYPWFPATHTTRFLLLRTTAPLRTHRLPCGYGYLIYTRFFRWFISQDYACSLRLVTLRTVPHLRTPWITFCRCGCGFPLAVCYIHFTYTFGSYCLPTHSHAVSGLHALRTVLHCGS